MEHYNFEKIQSFLNENGEQTTRFCLKTLNPSVGITIANTLRRILLSKLPGTAITAIRIDGIKHEYGIISGVREDTLELMLNFKQVKFRGLLKKKPYYANLNIKGPRLVTAADIPVPKGVNVINSHQYIATVAAQSELKLELKIESGKGYCNLNGDGLQDGFWNVDAVFTPVKNVNYKILDSYCFDSKVVEDLELEITTDGSVTPTDALLNSAKVLQNLFGSIVVSKPKIAHKVPRKSSRNIFIEELQLSARAYNCLNKMDIKTIEDLMQYSLKELKEIKNFGQKSVDEVIKKLKDQFDIHLN